MIKNYFKIAFRNLLKNKLYVSINIAGLTIGMTCFILIAFYIQYELSYENHHEKAAQIYRVAQIQEGDSFRGSDRSAETPAVLTPTLRDIFPEVEAATALTIHEGLFSRNGAVFYEQGLYSDEYIFDVFTFPIIDGIGKEALRDPNAIILTKSLAKKYFTNENPLGKILLFQNEKPLIVKGVIADVPKNQHFTFDYITSAENLPNYHPDDWNSSEHYTYIVLPEGYDYKKFDEKLITFSKKVSNESTIADFELFLQPLKDIHLHSQLNFEISTNSDIRYIYFFASIAFIILCLASINYMNLATAQSAQRTKEVGVRKVLGARKKQLVYQMLGESFLLTSISLFLAVLLADICLPWFNKLLNLSIPFSFSGNSGLLPGMLFIAFLIGGLSGLYPAVFLSGVSPIKAFQNRFLNNYKDGISLRNMLVVGQFAVAIALLIGSLVIFQQFKYIKNKKLGYNRNQIIYIPYKDSHISEMATTIRSELLKYTTIEKISFTHYLPLNMDSQTTIDSWEGNYNKEELPIYRNYVDHDFFDLFEMKIVEGRAFSPDYLTDSISSYILNESAIRSLGWKSGVGKRFRNGSVIGVVKDFHFQPFNLAIEPMFIALGTAQNSHSGNIAIKVKMDNVSNTLSYIKRTIKVIAPQAPFEYHFMDEAYNELYQSEQRFGQAFNIFTLLVLFIGCMGLFGLASHNIVQRTKEIGIRKVLGASIFGITSLLAKDFLKLVLLAILIASPIAWYFMNQWLADFAYRIDMEWWMFAVAGVAALAIAFLTIGFQSVKAALANPVKSLRSE